MSADGVGVLEIVVVLLLSGFSLIFSGLGMQLARGAFDNDSDI